MRRFTVSKQASMKFASTFSAFMHHAVWSKNFGLFSFASSNRKRTFTEDELAFLPAALEIVERPPPPAAGAIGATIIALFCLALVWAYFGRIDIVATAPGKILPSSRTKVVQPFETGVVRAIHVVDGQNVRSGDVLVELDSTMNGAERNHMQSDLIMAELDAARLTAALSNGPDPLAAFDPPPDASAALISTQRLLLSQQIDEYRAKLGLLERQQSQKQSELATIQATIAKFDALLPVLQQRVDIRNTLYSHETGSKASYLEIFQALVEMQQDILVQKSRFQEAQAAIAAIRESQAQTVAEYRRTLYAGLVESQRKVGGLKEDLIKAEQRTQFQQLTAPVNGTVQQLAIHTIGGVVTPAQALLVVVPADSRLEIESRISNRDIGFVHVGQEVEIKVDTFNFTRYGLLHGAILSVSQDAITLDRPQDHSSDTALGAATATSEPRGQELIYAARVSLDRTQMQVEENLVNLTPGMAVTVEIKTGSRRMIEYLLSPLLRYKKDSLRER
jgi:hemolysin D